MPRPYDIPSRRWQALLEDATRFVERFASATAAMGWGTGEVWGINAVKPCERYDAAGLVWMLKDTELVAVDTDKATVRTVTGMVQSIYRRPDDTLRQGERRLVWR